MATQSSLLPMSLPQQNASEATATGMGNPQTKKADEQWMQLDLSQSDIEQTVKIVSSYRDQWCTDRLIRQRIWIKNVLFYRGIQVIDWHDGSQTWVDSLAWYTGSDKVRDGESTELEKFIHPITLMLGQTFVGNMAAEVPLTVVKPHDARILADMTTAAAAQDAVGIIERRNGIRQMVRSEFEMLYLYGTYFKWTRGVLDGIDNGWDEELVLGGISIEQPDVMRCMQCGTDTPAGQMQIPEDGSLPSCPSCAAPMGPESYFEGGPAKTSLGVVGTRRVPRAMVKQTIHSPLEIDADPKAKDLRGTPILAFDTEIDIGEARMMFPGSWDKIREGAPTSTTANADYDRLRRDEVYSMGTAYTTDTNQQRPTYSQVWIQPVAYGRFGDKQYMQRMMAAAPDGLKISMIGGEVVGVKKAVLTKEWTCCRLRENFGLYCQSIAENVVSFNERFNSAMQAYDDYMMRAAFGLNLVDGSKIDVDKWKGNTLAPTTVVPVPLKQGVDSLSNVFQHFDIPVNPGLAMYPQMLWMFAQLLNGLPAQISGGGTNPDVETYGGQMQQLSQAHTGLTPFWENVKEEHARAAQNAIECLQELMRCGAVQELVDVIRDKGSQFRNNYVNFSRMQGQVDIYPDEDQDLPQSPDQLRKAFMTIFEQVGQGNPAAQAIFDVPANQELIGTTLYPGVISPVSAQRAKTLQDVNTLLEAQAMPVMRQDGSIGMQLPVEPSIVEDFGVALPTISEFMIENADLRIKNPIGWSQLEQYFGQCQDMQAQQGQRKAALELQVRQAGQPEPPPPDPGMQQIVAKLDGLATMMGEQLARLSAIDPMMTKGTITGQVSAAKAIVDAATDIGKAMAK